MPRLGQIVWEDIRASRLRRFPYIVYYRVLSDRVEVLAVLHGRRDSSAWNVFTGTARPGNGAGDQDRKKDATFCSIGSSRELIRSRHWADFRVFSSTSMSSRQTAPNARN